MSNNSELELDMRLEHYADQADKIVRTVDRQKVGSYMELLPTNLRIAVQEMASANANALEVEFRGKDARFIENKIARKLATRLKAVELFTKEEKFDPVDRVVKEKPGFFNKSKAEEYKPGTYLAITFKGSLLLVETGSFEEHGGRVVYKRLPLRGQNDRPDFHSKLNNLSVSPDTLAVGQSFVCVGQMTTSEVQLLYFRPGVRLDDKFVASLDTLFGKVDKKSAAIHNVLER